MSKVSNLATNDTRLCEGQAGLGAPAAVAPIQGDGIFGRWRYVPKYNVFVAVANSSQNVRSISTLRDAAIDAITAVGPVDYHNRVFSGTLSWT